MKQVIKDMHKEQVDKHVFERCLGWCLIFTEYDDEFLKKDSDRIEGLVEYLREVNTRRNNKKASWAVIMLLLDDCDVALEAEAWDDLATHLKCIHDLFERANLFGDVE